MSDQFELLEEMRQVRYAMYKVLYDGLISSEQDVVMSRTPNRQPLRQVLGYSAQTRLHRDALEHVLMADIQNMIAGTYHDTFEVREGVDWVYIPEEGGKNQVYYLAPKILDQWCKRLNGNDLIVAIMHRGEDNRWDVHYSLFEGDEDSSLRLTGGNIDPEKNMLLNFWFSPTELSGEEIFAKFPASDMLRWNLKFVGQSRKNGFTHFEFEFNGLGVAEHYAKCNFIEDLNQRYDAFLKSRGNFKFSVVQIGTVKIGGITHWIYTGSERIERI